MSGKKNWYIVDGYLPPKIKGGADYYEGHESIMILNCNDVDAQVKIDVYFEEREPILGIEYVVPAQRIRGFRSEDKEIFGIEIEEALQYSLRFTSNVGIIVQYGRMDVNQDNLAFLATMGYAE